MTNLSILRKKQSLTQKDLSIITGISIDQIKSIEIGRREVLKMNAEQYLKYCSALKIDPYSLTE